MSRVPGTPRRNLLEPLDPRLHALRGESVLAGVTSVIFALCGPEIATIAAAETPNAAPIISRLTINVAVRIALFYIASIALIVCVVPWVSIESGFSPFTAAFKSSTYPLRP